MGLLMSFIAQTNVSETMSTAMNTIKTDALGAISSVAPAALGIAGAFMVWRLGVRFFKSLAK